MTNQFKIIIAGILCIVFIALLFFYLSSEKMETEIIVNQTNENVKDKLNRDIDSVLSTFGIKKEWIKAPVVKGKETKEKDFIINREVLIPVDLAAIELNYEISNILQKYNLTDRVTEDPRTKNLVISIFSKKDSILYQTGKLNFIYTDSARRYASHVSIVLDSIDSEPITDAERILSSTEQLSVLMPLRNDKADYQSLITGSGKDYLLGLSIGDDYDIQADFNSGMKEKSLKSKIRSLSLSFSSASGVILTGRNVSPELYELVSNEFLKNNLGVYGDTIFSAFKKTDSKVDLLFEDIINKTNAGKKYLFYSLRFTPSEFAGYDEKVYKMKKLGYKFVSFKELIRIMTNKVSSQQNDSLKNTIKK